MSNHDNMRYFDYQPGYRLWENGDCQSLYPRPGYHPGTLLYPIHKSKNVFTYRTTKSSNKSQTKFLINIAAELLYHFNLQPPINGAWYKRQRKRVAKINQELKLTRAEMLAKRRETSKRSCVMAKERGVRNRSGFSLTCCPYMTGELHSYIPNIETNNPIFCGFAGPAMDKTKRLYNHNNYSVTVL